jgi:hypothetical protein
MNDNKLPDRYSFGDAIISVGGAIITFISLGMALYLSFTIPNEDARLMGTMAGVIMWIAGMTSYWGTVNGRIKNKGKHDHN